MSATVVRAAARVVTAGRVYEPGWVETSGETVIAVGAGRHERVDVDYGHATIVPGFVDIHVHGGGGGDYNDPDTESIRLARATHLAHGTTASNASLVTLSSPRLREAVERLAPLVADGLIEGVHLEGPCLNPVRRGAHDPGHLRTPEPAELRAVLDTGVVSMVTLAPELPGALDAIREISSRGAVAAIGHTDADYATTVAGIEAGARVGTHLFNAMRPLHHRDPGPAAALMEDERVTLELIADGTHLHPAVYRHVLSVAGADRVAIVTDAMRAAALGDGRFDLGTLDVEVADGVATLSGSDTIAGSTATMDVLFRSVVLSGADDGGASTHADWIGAVRQTSSTPAAAMGWAHVGDLAPGRRADVVVLDPDLRVVEVIAAGRPVPSGERTAGGLLRSPLRSGRVPGGVGAQR